eukprot:6546513-Prymnesium_polylepis.1
MAHKIELDLFVRGICTGHRGRSVADDLRESSECPLRPLRLLEEKFFELARQAADEKLGRAGKLKD